MLIKEKNSNVKYSTQSIKNKKSQNAQSNYIIDYNNSNNNLVFESYVSIDANNNIEKSNITKYTNRKTVINKKGNDNSFSKNFTNDLLNNSSFNKNNEQVDKNKNKNVKFKKSFSKGKGINNLFNNIKHKLSLENNNSLSTSNIKDKNCVSNHNPDNMTINNINCNLLLNEKTNDTYNNKNLDNNLSNAKDKVSNSSYKDCNNKSQLDLPSNMIFSLNDLFYNYYFNMYSLKPIDISEITLKYQRDRNIPDFRLLNNTKKIKAITKVQEARRTYKKDKQDVIDIALKNSSKNICIAKISNYNQHVNKNNKLFNKIEFSIFENEDICLSLHALLNNTDSFNLIKENVNNYKKISSNKSKIVSKETTLDISKFVKQIKNINDTILTQYIKNYIDYNKLDVNELDLKKSIFNLIIKKFYTTSLVKNTLNVFDGIWVDFLDCISNFSAIIKIINTNLYKYNLILKTKKTTNWNSIVAINLSKESKAIIDNIITINNQSFENFILDIENTINLTYASNKFTITNKKNLNNRKSIINIQNIEKDNEIFCKSNCNYATDSKFEFNRDTLLIDSQSLFNEDVEFISFYLINLKNCKHENIHNNTEYTIIENDIISNIKEISKKDCNMKKIIFNSKYKKIEIDINNKQDYFLVEESKYLINDKNFKLYSEVELIKVDYENYMIGFQNYKKYSFLVNEPNSKLKNCDKEDYYPFYKLHIKTKKINNIDIYNNLDKDKINNYFCLYLDIKNITNDLCEGSNLIKNYLNIDTSRDSEYNLDLSNLIIVNINTNNIKKLNSFNFEKRKSHRYSYSELKNIDSNKYKRSFYSYNYNNQQFENINNMPLKTSILLDPKNDYFLSIYTNNSTKLSNNIFEFTILSSLDLEIEKINYKYSYSICESSILTPKRSKLVFDDLIHVRILTYIYY